MKGRVAREYSRETTLRDVEERLRRHFSDMQGDSGREHIFSMMQYGHGMLSKIMREIEVQEERDLEMSTETESSFSTISGFGSDVVAVASHVSSDKFYKRCNQPRYSKHFKKDQNRRVQKCKISCRPVLVDLPF